MAIGVRNLCCAAICFAFLLLSLAVALTASSAARQTLVQLAPEEESRALEEPGNELESPPKDLQACEGRPNGVYADLDRACRVFRACQDSRAHLFWCANGTVFNPARGHCDAPRSVRCIDPKREILPSVVGDCSRQKDGVYTDYQSGCRKFYFCLGGRRTEFICPGTHLFDWRTGRCHPHQEVTCSALTCSKDQDGVFADYMDGCRRYYTCNAGLKTEFSCPQGTLFHDKLSQCHESQAVRCNGRAGFSCAGLPDGYYPDARTGCRNFVLCINHRAKSFACPSDLVFNRRHLACDYPWKANCEKPKENECTHKPNGVFAVFESDCRDFLVCMDGVVLQHGSCPQGKALNPVTGTCQPSTLVTCAPVIDLDCDGRPDGMYPDPKSNCSAFYVCIGGNRVVTSVCPGGTLFDVTTATCLPSVLVNCPLHLPTQPTEEGGVTYSQYECEGRIGVFPDYLTTCRGYKLCVDGKEYKGTCPEDSMYSIESGRCDNGTSDVNCQPPELVGTFRCRQGNGGIFVDYESGCKTWHECLNSEGVSYTCPEGQLFDIKRLMCREASKVRCHTSKMGLSLMSSLGKSITVVPPNETTPINCNKSVPGVFPSLNTGCKQFHVCAPSGLFSFRCPENSVFDPDRKICDSSPQAVCSSVDDGDAWVQTEDKFSCNDREDGTYPDYNQTCRRYFVCENGSKTTVYCPKGSRFNDGLMVCSDSEDFECKHEVQAEKHDMGDVTATEFVDVSATASPTTTTTTTPKPEVDYDSTIEDEEPTPTLPPYVASRLSSGEGTSKSAPEAQKFACPAGETGFFPDYDSGCRKFHICFRSITRTYSCPSVLLFNPITKTCDVPSNVTCAPQESSATPDVSRDVCYGKSRGYFADYGSGCQKYVSCNDGKALEYECPRGTLFNTWTWSCDMEDVVQCVDVNYRTPLTSGTPSTQRKLPHVHGIPQRFYFTCADMPDGFYPDLARHCHVFYRCHKGKKYSHYCKQGLLFNPKTGICDFEDNVKCSVSDTQTTFR
ncbi:uncharacterized protein LOC135366156 [Ornithodoros turicata]|uniref:uncharacterized protein LOC135366156 n=1 Tax=Ornithodoros turicata TaxID=34597 RepID=UPI003139EB60